MASFMNDLQSIINVMPDDVIIAKRVKEMVESNVTILHTSPFGFLTPEKQGQPVDLAKFFRYLNATDSVKDGANQYVAQEVFLNSFDDVRQFITPEKFKAFVRLHLLDDFTKVKKLCYTRIKGNDHSKPILPRKKSSINTKANSQESPVPAEDGIQEHDMTHVFYDCGFLPDKIINVEGVQQVETLGNKFDTGPSNTSQTNTNYFPIEETDLTEAVMGFQGFQHSHISFTGNSSSSATSKLGNAKSSNKSKSSEPEPHTCKTLQFRGFKYKNPETAINKFRIGNTQKYIALQERSIGLAQKSGFLMFKALQDRLMVLYYYFYCKMNIDQKCCLFTCDLVVAFCCYLFGQSFVYNQNDKQSKVTGLYWYNKDTIVNPISILNKERDALLVEYDSEIYLINSLNSSNFMFSGGVVIGNISETTVNRFKEHLTGCLQRVMQELNGINTSDVKFEYNWMGTDTLTTDPNRVDILTKKIKSYKLMSLFQRDNNGAIRMSKKKYVFISTRFQVCIADKLGYNPQADKKGTPSTLTRKRNLYEVFNHFKTTSGTTLRKGGEIENVSLIYNINNTNDGIYESDPHPEFNENVQTLYLDPMFAEEQLFMFIQELYNEVLKYKDIINSVIAVEVDTKLFDNGRVTPGDEKSPSDQTVFTPGSLYESTYNYGHIYDVFTYHFYADPDYTNENIAKIMAQIIIDTGAYGSTEIDSKLQGILKQIINRVAVAPMQESVKSTSGLNAKDESKETKELFPEYDEVAVEEPISDIVISPDINTAVQQFSATVSNDFKENGNLNNDNHDEAKLTELNITLNALSKPETFMKIFDYNGKIKKFTNDNHKKHIMPIPESSVYTNILTGSTLRDKTIEIVDIDTRTRNHPPHNNFLFGYNEAMYAYITGKQFKTNMPLTLTQRERLLYYLYYINSQIEDGTHYLRSAANSSSKKPLKGGKRTRKIRRKTNKNMRTTEQRRSVGVRGMTGEDLSSKVIAGVLANAKGGSGLGDGLPSKDNVKKYRKTRRRNKIRNHKCGIPGQAKQSTRKEFLTL